MAACVFRSRVAREGRVVRAMRRADCALRRIVVGLVRRVGACVTGRAHAYAAR